MVMDGVIAFDIDGVQANFTRGFTRIGHQLFGTPVGDWASQQTWNFQDFAALGLDDAKCKAIWKVIEASPDFWATLDPVNISVMSRINKIANKIFITNRPGINPKEQSEYFLQQWGIENPRVVLAAQKGPVAVQEGVVAIIDDLYTNVVDVKKAVPGCYAALLSCDYNKVHHDEWVNHHCGDVVLSIDHFIDECYYRAIVVEHLDQTMDDHITALFEEKYGRVTV